MCSECNDTLRRKRGCRKPPYHYTDGDMVFRSSSPMLREHMGGDILHECPIGKVQRESPYVLDAILVQGMADGQGFELLRQSRWLQQAFRVIGSERERHRLITERERQAKRDAAYGQRVLKGH